MNEIRNDRFSVSSSMAERKLPKLDTRVRFPSRALKQTVFRKKDSLFYCFGIAPSPPSYAEKRRWMRKENRCRFMFIRRAILWSR